MLHVAVFIFSLQCACINNLYDVPLAPKVSSVQDMVACAQVMYSYNGARRLSGRLYLIGALIWQMGTNFKLIKYIAFINYCCF